MRHQVALCYVALPSGFSGGIDDFNMLQLSMAVRTNTVVFNVVSHEIVPQLQCAAVLKAYDRSI